MYCSLLLNGLSFVLCLKCSITIGPVFVTCRRNADFYDASLYEAVMSCDGDCVSGGGELIVRVPRDVYKDYPSFVIGGEW